MEQTLGAALADPDVARDVQSGQLVTPLSYAGFGPAVAASLPLSRPERDLPAPHPVPRANELAQLRQRQRLERDLVEATKRRDAAARRVRDAEQAWGDAERTVQRLTDQLDEPG